MSETPAPCAEATPCSRRPRPPRCAGTPPAPSPSTDGAFAETKEALGGYYLIEAADLDEALALAKQVPAPFGGVEVRPIRTFA